jgi:hypothetical protein
MPDSVSKFKQIGNCLHLTLSQVNRQLSRDQEIQDKE